MTSPISRSSDSTYAAPFEWCFVITLLHAQYQHTDSQNGTCTYSDNGAQSPLSAARRRASSSASSWGAPNDSSKRSAVGYEV